MVSEQGRATRGQWFAVKETSVPPALGSLVLE